MLLHHPVALDLFCLVTGSSQYFADMLARQPETIEIITNPGVRGGTKTAARFYRDASSLVDACQRPELKRDALRRWKAREMLRIGVRDLAGLAAMPATAREFSNLADACAQKALDIALATLGGMRDKARGMSEASPHSSSLIPHPFAVIAMGKLGGQELNYSSDIDLMFVHGDHLPPDVQLSDGRKMETITYLNRLAETLIKVLNEDSANGHVFRVDMRLRPEGRFGPLTRSLAGYQAYYESWAENWERQALLKARFIAGDRALGEAFMALVEPYVYRRHVSQEFLSDVRANKRRIEHKCALEGETDTNIKTGCGGIRDVEFIVQRLQLQLGGVNPRLRTPNTLTALHRLFQSRILTAGEAEELAEDYQFLRNLEHRLQLLHGFQTQTLPPANDDRERTKLARRMGFRDRALFETALSERRNRVHHYLQSLFYDDIATFDGVLVSGEWAELNLLLEALDTPGAQTQLAERLKQAGFQDVPAALRVLHISLYGNEFGGMPPDTPARFKTIAPRLLSLCAHSPDPDAALGGIESLALAVPNRAQLYAAFAENFELLPRLVSLAAVSPPLWKQLVRHQEWLDSLLDKDPEQEGREETPTVASISSGFEYTETSSYLSELRSRMKSERDYNRQLDRVARFLQRERLLIGARDIWEEHTPRQTMQALTQLAGAALQILLDICAEPLIVAHAEPEFARRVLGRVAIIGLGKLGGGELGYGSDWDVLFVYDEEHQRGANARSHERVALVDALVERLNTAGKTLAAKGADVEIDLRLRPWGRKGALIHNLRGFAQYYRREAETWERQAALKARPVAGNPIVGARLVRLLQAVSYGRGVNREEDQAVQSMKQRIEAERLKPGERETDVKLGYGGLTDIEWLCQRLQLRHGRQSRTLRQPNTLRALSALAGLRLLDNAEADTLTETYLFLTRLRNLLWLQSGRSVDVLPDDAQRRSILARSLGYVDTAEISAAVQMLTDVRQHMQEARRIFTLRFVHAE